MVLCGANAECNNTKGGYECRCKKGYAGDGIQCSPVERCYSRFGRSCSSSGSCEEYPDGPRCVCARGYRGDGFTCTAQTPIHSSVEDITTLLRTEQTHENTGADVGDHPFVMTDWHTPIRTSPRPMNTRARLAPQPSSTAKPAEKTTKLGAQEDMAEATTLLFLIGPAVLCAIWVILVIVVIAVCCRNKHSQRTGTAKQGIWGPPIRGSLSAPSNASQQFPSRIRPFESY
ncbi:hypothetical protein GCK32_016453 [Trichostrongylus colubriformis]|uniref:EGF-like domain-containing protein n=1 Tax=Trichostrongylus colubriformis TaxID=6319 RepID=A0AAN8EYI7_TRICO